MQEQAFLAKQRRRLIGALAPLLPASVLTVFQLSAPERAALALRKASKSPLPQSPVTTFAIPLVGKHQVTDWAVIEETLARCLRALIGQSDPNWRAVICSQSRPAACDLDPRISFVAFDQTFDGHDKVAKLETLAEYACSWAPLAGYYMPLDGDDLLHRDFVARTHTGGDNGILVSGGLILNAGTGDLGRTTKRRLTKLTQKPFWKFCGSCMALPVGRALPEERAFFQGLAQHEHRLYPYLAKLAGIDLRTSEDPLALYIVNHGENFETRRGRGGFKQRFAKRHALSGTDKTKALEGFPEAAPLIATRTDAL